MTFSPRPLPGPSCRRVASPWAARNRRRLCPEAARGACLQRGENTSQTAEYHKKKKISQTASRDETLNGRFFRSVFWFAISQAPVWTLNMIFQRSKGGEIKYEICELLKCLFMFKSFSMSEFKRRTFQCRELFC